MVIGFILLGCAGGGPSYSSQAPAGPTAVQLLLDSGFKKIYPTTPAQKAGLQSMPQRQI
jgi:hypothetical protein